LHWRFFGERSGITAPVATWWKGFHDSYGRVRFFKTVLNEGKDSTAQASPVYSLSFIANGVLYGVFGLLIGSVKNILLRPK
jgi:hypothetical protein